MVIWARWGILGLIIPVALIVIAMSGAETIAKQRMRSEDQKSVKKAPVADDAENDHDETCAIERKKDDNARKQAIARAKTLKRAEHAGYLIGGLASAAVLWPLGRRMNGAGEN